jgi:uroporphyrinogen-III synthase
MLHINEMAAILEAQIRVTGPKTAEALDKIFWRYFMGVNYPEHYSAEQITEALTQLVAENRLEKHDSGWYFLKEIK